MIPAPRQHRLAEYVPPGSTVYLRDESTGRFSDEEWTYNRKSEKGYLQVKRPTPQGIEYRSVLFDVWVQVQLPATTESPNPSTPSLSL